SDFNTNGFYNDPVHQSAPGSTNGDFWPGFYSRTHVGATDFSYAAVMDGLRAGRVWVTHGGLVDLVDVRVQAGGQQTTLGGVLFARRGTRVKLTITMTPAQLPNWWQFGPQLAHVDVIGGPVTGAASDRDTIAAPGTRVVKTWDVSSDTETFTLHHD